MLLQEIFDLVLIQSGAFGMGSDALELKLDPHFRMLTQKALGFYSEYYPIERFSQIAMGTRQYTFSTNDIHGIPTAITAAIPIRISGTYPYYLRGHTAPINDYMDEKYQLPFEYRRPILTTAIDGEFDIQAFYKRVLKQNASGEWYSDDIDVEEDHFFDYLAGELMIAVGRNRRAFQMDDLPITLDADSLVSEGQEMKEKAEEMIKENSKFYLAWR